MYHFLTFLIFCSFQSIVDSNPYDIHLFLFCFSSFLFAMMKYTVMAYKYRYVIYIKCYFTKCKQNTLISNINVWNFRYFFSCSVDKYVFYMWFYNNETKLSAGKNSFFYSLYRFIWKMFVIFEFLIYWWCIQQISCFLLRKYISMEWKKRQKIKINTTHQIE